MPAIPAPEREQAVPQAPRLAAALLGLVGAAAAAGALLLLCAEGAQASHYRHSTLSWEPTGTPGEVRFFGALELRRSAYGNLQVGDSIHFVKGIQFGDGLLGTLYLRVTEVNSTRDWIRGELFSTPGGDPILHVYPPPLPGVTWVASIEDCCLVGQAYWAHHVNNPDLGIRVQVAVNPGLSGASPVTALKGVQLCEFHATCTIPTLFSDPDGDALTFRFAHASEVGAGFVQAGPPDSTHAAAVDPATGTLTWNTTGATIMPSSNTMYSVAVVASDGSTNVSVYFLICLTSATPGGAPFSSEEAASCLAQPPDGVFGGGSPGEGEAPVGSAPPSPSPTPGTSPGPPSPAPATSDLPPSPAPSPAPAPPTGPSPPTPVPAPGCSEPTLGVEAGPDAVAWAREGVLLRAATSQARGPVLHGWTQEGGPTVDVAGAATEALGFTAPDVGEEATLRFRVQAWDDLCHAEDVVAVTVRPFNARPVADAGADRTAAPGDRVALDGRHSFDREGSGLTYAWQQVAGPAVDANQEGSRLLFTATAAGELGFLLVVTDGERESLPDPVEVRVQGAAPWPAAVDGLQGLGVHDTEPPSRAAAPRPAGAGHGWPVPLLAGLAAAALLAALWRWAPRKVAVRDAAARKVARSRPLRRLPSGPPRPTGRWR